MKAIRFFIPLLVALSSFAISHAGENGTVLVGQTETGGQTRVAFVLELLEQDIQNYCVVNEKGEVFLKVDRVIAMPNGALQSSLGNNWVGQQLNLSEINTAEAEWIYCRNRECGKRFHWRPEDRVCPYCRTLN